MRRRAGAARASPYSLRIVIAADLAFAGLARQAELVASKEVSPRELVDACLERIEELNPRLNAFRVVFAERARAEADQAEARLGAGGAEDRPPAGRAGRDQGRRRRGRRGHRLGKPGAWSRPLHDAEVVARLRAAGAIVIGKTNVPELTIFPFTETEAFGLTRNPWNRERTTGGSSGGTAAAVAAGMVGGGVGSDGGGSIRIPAACCGLFGIKPQRGRISLAPRREAWHGLSVIGPLTRRVIDAALFLDVTAGAATGDIERAEPPQRSFVEAAATPPGELRLAFSSKVPPGLIAKVGAEQKRALEETAELLGSLGHRVVWESPAYGLASTALPRALAARHPRRRARHGPLRGAGAPHEGTWPAWAR